MLPFRDQILATLEIGLLVLGLVMASALGMCLFAFIPDLGNSTPFFTPSSQNCLSGISHLPFSATVTLLY